VLLIDLAANHAAVYKIRISAIEELLVKAVLNLELFQINVKHIYSTTVTGVVIISHCCVSTDAITSLLLFKKDAKHHMLLCLLAGYRERKGQTSQR
jgi:hypothetical protein